MGPASTRGRGLRGRGRTASQISGRGRGRGKGRARGRGRGKSSARGDNRPDEALHILETRKERFRGALNDMPVERMRELLVAAMEQNPALMLDIFEPPSVQPGGFHPSEESETPEWCVCCHCREMPTQTEKLCCGKTVEHCVALMPKYQYWCHVRRYCCDPGGTRTCHLQDFRVLILDEAVLALQCLYRRDILVLGDEEDLRKANRHAAYRQFVLWQHGQLGVGDRRVIPSCCVWRIRDKYPDAFGQYTGFIPSRLV